MPALPGTAGELTAPTAGATTAGPGLERDAAPRDSLVAVAAEGIEFYYPPGPAGPVWRALAPAPPEPETPGGGPHRERRGRSAWRSRPARRALAGVSFRVRQGEIFGFFGPNGGGKSTLFRILATLARPAAGSLELLGLDPLRQRAAARRLLGVVFQSPSLDLQLTCGENLLHQGHLYGLRGRALAERSAALLERFGLGERRRERAAALSGGLRRRLEVAKALLHRPCLLLLDEPSTGLDPGARSEFWEVLAGLRRDGVTVLLTTHFMEEGDRCDRLALLDRGRIVAEGTPAALEQEVGGDVVTLTGPDPQRLAADLAARYPELVPAVEDGAVRVTRPRAHELVARLVEALPGRIDSITVARPTLEDVFLQRTGSRFRRSAWQDEEEKEPAAPDDSPARGGRGAGP